MYVKINNGTIEKFPYSIGDLRSENPNTSFPDVVTQEMFEFYGIFKVTEQECPATDKYSYAVRKSLPEFIDSQWMIAWDIVHKTQEEIAEEIENEKSTVRDLRNRKLASCDWTQIPDAPLTAEKKAEWAAYRQQLRDVPTQAGFPEQVQWPTKPEV